MSVVSSRIKKEREKRGWSQLQLAEKVSLNNSVLSRIESGKRPIEDHELKKFADIFEVSTDYLLGLSNNPKPDAIKESRNLAFYGGGDDLTEDELEIVRAALEAYRKGKKAKEEKKD